ncbi:MAG: hypothetical protein KDB08_10870, partial [Microthrixaceae bacterium]|nr:hypothetical protein [Microthrixaceae bacterium]
LVLQPLRALAESGAPEELVHEVARAGRSFDHAVADHASADEAQAKTTAHTDAAVRADLDAETATKESSRLGVLLDRARRRQQTMSALARDHARLAGDVAELDRKLIAADLDAPTAKLTTAAAQLSMADAALQSTAAALARARADHTRHLAGDLAALLEPDEPCPVCGSREHPSPAPRTADADVGVLEVERDRCQKEHSRAEEEWKRASETLDGARAAADSLPSADDQAAMRARAHEASVAAEELGAVNADVESLTQSIADLTGVAARSTERAAAERAAAADAAARMARHRTEAELVLRADQIDRTRLDVADVRATVSELASSTGALATKAGAYAQTTAEVGTALVAEGFPDERSLATALLHEAQREHMEQLLAEAADRSIAIARHEGTIGDAPVPPERPDVDGLRALSQDRSDAARIASDLAATLDRDLKGLRRLTRSIEELGPDVDRLVDRARRAKEIADVIVRGKGTLLGLERWIQRALFEEVCAVAGERVAVLSHGRYVLTLDATGQRQGARAAGLDLYVTDSHTGRTRPVQTLSGGEQFLTSLALALALAEVVQNRSGGIELATLFIDEGFGSLDGDTLETAVEVLRSLQDAGRTVGLISHVEAMRQELPVGLEVIPSPSGSVLRCLSPIG